MCDGVESLESEGYLGKKVGKRAIRIWEKRFRQDARRR